MSNVTPSCRLDDTDLDAVRGGQGRQAVKETALAGSKPQDAFFVRTDRTTMG